MGIEIEASRVFEAPTVAELASHLETLIRARRAGHPPSTILPTARDERMPASIAQERVWKFQRSLPEMPFFNILYVLRLISPVNPMLLEQSLNQIVQRHEILRTSFAIVDNRYVQVIAPTLMLQLRFDDLYALPKSKKETVGHGLIQEEVLHTFDPAKGPLIRSRLVRLADKEHILVITMHQMIADGWSLGVLGTEIFASYQALAAEEASPAWVPLTIQYADVAYWQRHWQSRPELVQQLEYWRQQLRDPLPMIQLARVRSVFTIDHLHTARRGFALPARLADSAKHFGNSEGVTFFVVLIAAFKTLLQRYFGQEDLRIATHVANRNRPGTEALIGPMVNTVILRTNLRGDPNPQEIVRRVRETTLGAFARQDLPFEELVDTLTLERGLKPAELAQFMIVFQNASLRPIEGSGQSLVFEEANPGIPMPLITATTFDLVLTIFENKECVVGSCIYKPHLFPAMAIDYLLRDFQQVLKQMVRKPEQPISGIHVSEWQF
jgi:hypothetical protein